MRRFPEIEFPSTAFIVRKILSLLMRLMLIPFSTGRAQWLEVTVFLVRREATGRDLC